MPDGRIERIVLVVGALALMAGCTTIAPVATTLPSTSPGASPAEPSSSIAVVPSAGDVSSPAASDLPPTQAPSSEAPTIVPPTSQPPTSAPVETTKPTHRPKPTAAAGPNLIVGKFEIVADAVVAAAPFDAVFTIRNNGAEDAPPFQAVVLEKNTEDGGQSQSGLFSVEGGLAAGDSVEVTITMTLPKATTWQLTATADSGDTVDETNEDDNGRAATVDVLSGLPDLAWANGGFSMTPSQTKPGYYDVAFDVINTGTADVNQETAWISVTWYRNEDSASGDLAPVPIIDLAQGEERVLEQSEQMPGPGTYKVYAYLDRDHVYDELSEVNNEVQINVTVP